MKSLKDLLLLFNIETNSIRVSNGNNRKKDGRVTKVMTFQIKANSIDKFINEFGWLK